MVVESRGDGGGGFRLGGVTLDCRSSGGTRVEKGGRGEGSLEMVFLQSEAVPDKSNRTISAETARMPQP